MRLNKVIAEHSPERYVSKKDGWGVAMVLKTIFLASFLLSVTQADGTQRVDKDADKFSLKFDSKKRAIRAGFTTYRFPNASDALTLLPDLLRRIAVEVKNNGGSEFAVVGIFCLHLENSRPGPITRLLGLSNRNDTVSCATRSRIIEKDEVVEQKKGADIPSYFNANEVLAGRVSAVWFKDFDLKSGI